MNTWLTRITPDPHSVHARRDLGDAVRIHQRVMTLLPDDLGDGARATTNTLYRVEEATTGLHLLAQTGIKPDTSRLPHGYTHATRDLTPLLDALHTGMRVRYRLVANPTKRHSRTAGADEGKIAVLTGDAADTWWRQRTAACGLHLGTLTSHTLPPIVGRRTGAKPIRYTATRFDGTATITDPELLRTAVIDGIGRGKAYGCGLISLAPA